MIVRAGAAFTALRGLGGGPSDCDDGVVYVVDQKISKIREVSWGGLTGTLGGIDDLAGAANGCGGNSCWCTRSTCARGSAVANVCWMRVRGSDCLGRARGLVAAARENMLNL